jgi:hypothetical protein
MDRKNKKSCRRAGGVVKKDGVEEQKKEGKRRKLEKEDYLVAQRKERLLLKNHSTTTVVQKQRPDTSQLTKWASRFNESWNIHLPGTTVSQPQPQPLAAPPAAELTWHPERRCLHTATIILNTPTTTTRSQL